MDVKHVKAALEAGRKLPWWIEKEVNQMEEMKVLRLFCVKNRKTGKVVLDGGVPAYFLHKGAAKELRDIMGGPETYKVSPGPDHRDYLTDEESWAKGHMPKKGSAKKRATKGMQK